MGRRLIHALAAGIVVAFVVSPIAFAADEPVLVFDLANGTEVTEHTAQLLYNLNTNNITHPSVSESWNAWYEELPGQVSGDVTIDLEAATVRGQLTERWTCTDCVDEEGIPTYADTLDMGWTATFEAHLVPTGSGYDIEGTTQIAYHANVTSNEEPSMCGNEECYICKDRVCEIKDALEAQAPISGTLAGEILSLAFVDRLEADAHEMNFDDIRYTEFIMGRFSITMQGVVHAPTVEDESESEPEEPPTAEEETSAAETDPVEAPSQEAAAEEDSAETESESAVEDPEETDGESAPSEVSGAAAPATSTKDGFGELVERFGLLLAMVLLLFVLLGGGFWWYRGNRTPPGPPSAGAAVKQFKRTPDEIGAGPAYMLQSTDGKSYVEGTRGSQVIAYDSGTVVDVVGRAADSIQVRVGDHPPIWIEKKNLHYLRR